MKLVENTKFFERKHSLSKRGFNSRRDKRERWFKNHPASGFRSKHGREKGR